MWKRSLLVALFLLAAAGPAHADRTIYMAVMCDTNLSGKEGLKKEVAKCGADILSMIEAFRNQGIRCADPAFISGDEVGLNEVRRRIASFPIDRNDTLIFYYVGHGKSRGRQHILDASCGEITRDEARQALLSAPRVPPRLILLVTECCANESARPQELIPMYGLSLDEKVPNKSLLENLLLEHSGIVDITSSSYNQPSVPRMFALSIKFHMESESSFEWYDLDKNGFVTWKEFFPKIIRTTNDLYRKALPDGNDPQTPFSFSLGTAPGMSSPRSTRRISACTSR